MPSVLYSSRNIAILGGGAAGMSCALWLKHLGFSPVLIEPGAALGGQLLRINRINRWILGIPARTGPALAELYGRHVTDEAIDVRLGAQPVSMMAEDPGFSLVVREREHRTTSLPARALVIATGLRVNSSDILHPIPGALPLYESGLLSFFPLDHLESMEVLEGKRVAVIGGGDNAHFTAKDLASRTALTHLIIRSRPRAQPMVRKEVEALIRQGRVQEHGDALITGFHQGSGGIAIALARNDSKAERIEVNRIFARTGFAPNTEFLVGLGLLAGLKRNGDGYVQVDAWKRASLPFVYAIGDVANPDHPSVVTAIADGAVAAQAIAQDLGA
jgi:thioredoxin reductase (NADPH)